MAIVNGTAAAEVLNGTVADDTLKGLGGNDTLDGGSGNDLLQGGAGSDIYRFYAGAGNDTVSDFNATTMAQTGTADAILFSGINFADVTFERVPTSNDLIIRLTSTGETLTLLNQLATPYIESFRFADRTYTAAQIAPLATTYGTMGGDLIQGSDTLDDRINGLAGYDTINGYGGNDLLDGGTEGDLIDGGAGNDTLLGGSGWDELYGGDGNDTFSGGQDGQLDRMYGGAGDDTYLFGAGNGWDAVYEDSGPTGGNDTIVFTGLNRADVTVSLSGPTLFFQINGSIDALDYVGSIENFRFMDGTFTARQLAGTQWAYGTDMDDHLTTGFFDTDMWGYDGNDQLDGGDGYDTLYGGAGNDSLSGGAGDDVYAFVRGDGHDLVDETTGSGFDTIALGDPINPINFADLVVEEVPGTTDAVLRFKDPVTGLLGSDQILIRDFMSGQIESFQFADGVRSFAEVKALIVPGALFTGTAAANLMNGGAGADTLNGLGGNDTLNGGAGADRLNGGVGNDTYLFSAGSGNDTVIDFNATTLAQNGTADVVRFTGLNLADVSFERTLGGTDLIVRITATGETLTVANQVTTPYIESFQFADGTYTAAQVADLTMLVGTAAGDWIDGGDLLNDRISGLGGADTLYGYGGNDLLVGGTGSDQLYGGAGNDTLEGGAGWDTLYGGAGNDTLSGGVDGMTDWLNGEAGDDTYLFGIGSGWDSISEGWTPFDGNDTIVFTDLNRADVSVTVSGPTLSFQIIGATDSLDYWGSIENFQFMDGTFTARQLAGTQLALGTGDDDNINYHSVFDTRIEGLGGNDQIYGGTGYDTLNGGTGDDSLFGGAGDDVYTFARGDGRDLVDETTGGGLDTLAVGNPTNPINFADLVVEEIPGTTDAILRFKDPLTGQPVSDQIVIRDFMSGQIESFQFADGLRSFAEVKALVVPGALLTGTAAANLMNGGAGADTLNGLGGNDTLNGGAGADRLNGGVGNDTYLFGAGSGNDTVIDFNATTLAQNGTADVVRFTGLNLANVTFERIVGGSDLIARIAATGETLIIANQATTPYIESFQFADGTYTAAQIAGLTTLIGTAANEVFNGSDTLNDRINAMGGADSLLGLGGDDLLDGGSGDDFIDGGAGNDTLKGGGGWDTLYGGDGNDTLAGGMGWPDELHGGAGDDTYLVGVGSGFDWVYEDATPSGGNDTIIFSGLNRADVGVDVYGDTLSLTFLSAPGSIDIIDIRGGVENFQFMDGTLTLSQLLKQTGTAGDDVLNASLFSTEMEGLAGNDLLLGNVGNDTLAGGTGHDTLVGAEGDDLYLFSRGDGHDLVADLQPGAPGGGIDTLRLGSGANPINFADVVVEAVPGTTDAILRIKDPVTGKVGTDNILIRDFMSGQIENFEFSDGVRSFAEVQALVTPGALFTGTAAANLLNGGAGADTLNGLGGNDTLNGGAGADKLNGGAGNDTYLFTVGSGNDTVIDFNATTLAQNGTTDTIRFTGLNLADVTFERTLGGGDVVARITATGETLTIVNQATTPYIESFQFANGTYTAAQIADLTTLRGTNGNDWIDGSDLLNDRVDGEAGDDTLSGFGGDDWLSGGAGSDWLNGGAGNDTLFGGRDGASDWLVGGTGDDTYLFGVGSGAEYINDDAGGNDTLVFDGVNRADAHVFVVGSNLSISLNGSDWVDITGSVENFQFMDGTFTLGQLTKQTGTAGDDFLMSSPFFSTEMEGLAGNDLLTSGFGNDTLTGGAGNDTVIGAGGDDLYLFGRGDGHDLLGDFLPGGVGGGTDTLRLGSAANPINFADVVVEELPGTTDAILRFKEPVTGLLSTDNILIRDFMSGQIENFEFSDGMHSFAEVQALITPGALFTGTAAANVMNGGAGADTLNGLGGNDTLNGGMGADRLNGGAGNDTYLFGAGSGNDTVIDFNATTLAQNGTTDTVRFTGLNLADVTFERLIGGSDLIVRITATDETLTLTNQLTTPYIESFQFANGTFTAAQITAMPILMRGTPLPDIIDGSDTLNDWIDGAGGDDFIFGYGGDDRLQGSDGQDHLVGGAGNDLLDGGAQSDVLEGGIGADTLTGGTGSDVFVYTGINDGGDVITDFETGAGGDLLDLTMLGLDPLNLAGYVQVTEVTNAATGLADTVVAIDMSGTATAFTTLVTLQGVPMSTITSLNYAV